MNVLMAWYKPTVINSIDTLPVCTAQIRPIYFIVTIQALWIAPLAIGTVQTISHDTWLFYISAC